MRLYLFVLLFAMLPGLTATPLVAQSAARPIPPLWSLYATLKSKTWVDLTHSLDSTTPHSKGLTPLERKTLATVKTRGAFMETTMTVGQWGTHVDSPAHFHDGLRTTSDIPVTEMLLPLVVLDVHTQVEKNPDYTLTLADVQAWEAKHGTIPAGAFVAMRSDWSKRWPDQTKIENLDNLDEVPEAGALIVATWPKLEKGSGFPARVFAVVP